MRAKSPTRLELEKALRAALPAGLSRSTTKAGERPATAAAGAGGLLAGYVWGWLRGRRRRGAS